MARLPKFLNTNALWGAVGAKTLQRCGLTHVIISPGSRSTPLAHAFATTAGLNSIVALDERSAAFQALGLSKATGCPTALLCTSGTAAANYLPAVIEARLSGTPLIILTADRPPELRECHSGQTINQNGIYGSYPVWSAEVAVPANDLGLLRHWRQTLVNAWQCSQGPLAGPVHLNLPFRDPLAPTESEKGFKTPAGFDLEAFTKLPPNPIVRPTLTPATVASLLPQTDRGVIVVGPHAFENRDESAAALRELSQLTGWPILSDGAGTLRGDLAGDASLVSGYDLILRDAKAARALRPQAAVFVGPLPTSKVLRAWLKDGDITALQLGRVGENTDPTHSRWCRLDGQLVPSGDKISTKASAYAKAWQTAQKAAAKKLTRIVNVDWPFEGRVVSLLDEALGPDDRLFVGSSMPIRDVEWFYHPPGPGPEVLTNRGANGIDGTVSTALGASLDGKRTVLLCGDLTFLHDSNALLSAYGHAGDLTILVINNEGGGIFNHLAVADDTAHFEKLWGTPQAADLGKLCAAHKVRHDLANDWNDLRRHLEIRGKGVRVIEFRTDRETNAAWRQKSFRS
ncbi:MAG: 2-succinyl-5-enolpyruvyl-6-hydroxy-3-cyclohexene-1-carboxylic-acid synthase [Verrucomicrobiota bacterium]